MYWVFTRRIWLGNDRVTLDCFMNAEDRLNVQKVQNGYFANSESILETLLTRIIHFRGLIWIEMTQYGICLKKVLKKDLTFLGKLSGWLFSSFYFFCLHFFFSLPLFLLLPFPLYLFLYIFYTLLYFQFEKLKRSFTASEWDGEQVWRSGPNAKYVMLIFSLEIIHLQIYNVTI